MAGTPDPNHCALSSWVRYYDVAPVSGERAWEGAWHWLWDELEVVPGTYNERMLEFCNCQLGASHTDLPQAMHWFAVSRGYENWSALRDVAIVLGEGLQWQGSSIEWLTQVLLWHERKPLLNCGKDPRNMRWLTRGILWNGQNLNWGP